MEVSNSEVIQDVVKQGQIQSGKYVTAQLASTIQPVIEVGRNSKVANIIRAADAASGTVTVFTAPATKDFYLCSATISRTHIITDNGTYTQMIVTPAEEGTTGIPILFITGVTLTVDSQTIAINFPRPIKIKRGTTIQVTDGGTYTRIGGCITGFTIEEH